MNSPEARIRFGGHELVLHAHGVMYWPAERTLVASDLHFEKSTFLARAGSFIPPYDTLDTLDRLEQLVAHYQPQRLILLGDSFHDAHAWARLSDTLRERIAALAARVTECIWVEGNHDIGLHSHALGALTGGITIAGIHFAHDSIAAVPTVIGHYHPKASMGGTRGKCFIHSESLLIMPSFGSYTGGLSVKHEVIQSLYAKQQARVHLLFRNTIYLVPN